MTEQFLDLHTHVVYGVDDGARTEEQMRAMLDAAVANGITTLVFNRIVSLKSSFKLPKK